MREARRGAIPAGIRMRLERRGSGSAGADWIPPGAEDGAARVSTRCDRRMGSEASCPAERRGWRLTEFRGLPPRISPRVNAVARIHGLAQRRDGPLGIRVGDLDPMRAAWETTLQHLVLPPHLLVWMPPVVQVVDRVHPGLEQLLGAAERSEEHTSELQSRENFVCRLLLEQKNITRIRS